MFCILHLQLQDGIFSDLDFMHLTVIQAFVVVVVEGGGGGACFASKFIVL